MMLLLSRLPKDVQKIVWKKLYDNVLCTILYNHAYNIGRLKGFKYINNVCGVCSRYISGIGECYNCRDLMWFNGYIGYYNIIDIIIYRRFCNTIFPQYRLDQNEKNLK